jgi:hypothetical protein
VASANFFSAAPVSVMGGARLRRSTDRRSARRCASRHAIGPQLAEVARRLLEGRPVLLLLRRQREAALSAGEPRLAERAHVSILGCQRCAPSGRPRCCA